MVKIIKSMIPNSIKAMIKKILMVFRNKSGQTISPPIPYETNLPIRILFIAQHTSIWSTWSSVIQAFKENSLIEVQVLLAPFIHKYGDKKNQTEMVECLNKNGIPFFQYDSYSVDSFKPHVVFLQNPYDSTRPEALSSDNLRKKGYRIAYIPYGLEMGGGQENIKWQFNLDFHHNAWRIFARSSRHKAMYAKYSENGDVNVVITGHPKFDCQFRGLQTSQVSAELKGKVAGRRVVLWTPHFSVALPATWSTYRIYGQAIMKEAESRPDLFFIIRPHPLFWQAMIENGLWTQTEEQNFRDKCKSQNNLWLDESNDYIPVFNFSDALMTDVGSFLLEFLPTGKPILYLHHPDGSGLNDDGEITNHLYKAESIEEIVDFLNNIESGKDSKKAERIAALPEYLYGLDGNISKRICQHIINAIQSRDESNLLNAEPFELQKISVDYWKNASSTFLAPAEYYVNKRDILKTILLELPKIKNAIDIGCGDGYFTKVIAENAEIVDAYDVSKTLIEQASLDSKSEGILNISFEVKELDDAFHTKTYDLVSCMGVISCILDEVKYKKLLDQLRFLSKRGGYLLLTDTLSENEGRLIIGDNGYVAKYRYLDSYIQEIISRDFEFIKSIDIKKIESSALVNKFFLFRLKSDS